MEKITVSARNNLKIPIRLTLSNVSSGQDDACILITIGNEGAALKDFYRICIDTDILPNQDWDDVGSLCIDTKCKVSIEGKTETGV